VLAPTASNLTWFVALFYKIRSLGPAEEAAWWSALGTLLTAALTFIGVIAAIGAAIGAYKLFRVEFRRDQERFRDLVREQADLVSCWLRFAPGQGTGRLGTSNRWTTEVLNASVLPVHDVELTYFFPGLDDSGSDLTVVVKQGRQIPVLPPSPEPWDKFLPDEMLQSPFLNRFDADDMSYLLMKVSIAFTDMKERRWLRDQDGRLHQIPNTWKKHWLNGMYAAAAQGSTEG
jgi:hypothetical protein